MRALCGAIIAAGALIGLGLASVGFGLRFQAMPDKHAGGTFDGVYMAVPTLTLALILLILGLLIGVAIAFMGLAYHHHRRHFESLRQHGGSTQPPMPVS